MVEGQRTPLKLNWLERRLSSDPSLAHRLLGPAELTRWKLAFVCHLVCLHSVGRPTPVTGGVGERGAGSWGWGWAGSWGWVLASPDSSR